ncbi:MAG: GNAT family N-acetyltransferase [Usitatibacter sp.]
MMLETECAFRNARTIDAAAIVELFAAPGCTFLLCLDGEEIIGCAYLKQVRPAAYMGLLAVRPLLQARGIGTALIAECERVARGEWRCPTMLISVITSHRPELTAFYERRGYARTGRYKTFERKHASPKIAGLILEWMEKDFASDLDPQRR